MLAPVALWVIQISVTVVVMAFVVAQDRTRQATAAAVLAGLAITHHLGYWAVLREIHTLRRLD